MAAAAAKEKGNALFREGKYADAAAAYSEAIALDNTDATFYSNRCACYLELDKADEAFADSLRCLQLKPTWVKAYFRHASSLAKKYRHIEARGCCLKGLEFESGSAEIKTLLHEAQIAISRHFSNASDVDFRMDKPPNTSFRLVFRGKPAEKDARLDETFPMTRRGMLHVAVLMQHTKIAVDLIKRGANPMSEDVFGLSPLHYAALIGNDAMTNAIKQAIVQFLTQAGAPPSAFPTENDPVSSKLHCSPAALARVMTVCNNSLKEKIFFYEPQGGERELSGQELLQKDGVFVTETSVMSEEFFQMMLGALPDDTMEKTEQSMRLTAAIHTSAGHENVVLAKIDETVGYGIYARKAFKANDYVCAIFGIPRDASKNPDLHTNSAVFKLQPNFDYRIDTTDVRSLGAYVNHSSTPNCNTEQVLSHGIPAIAIYANRDIEKGEQILINYEARISTSSEFMSNLSNATVFAGKSFPAFISL